MRSARNSHTRKSALLLLALTLDVAQNATCSNKSHSFSAEAEAEKNQEQQVEDAQKEARTPDEENGRRQEQCPPVKEARRRVSSVRT